MNKSMTSIAVYLEDCRSEIEARPIEGTPHRRVSLMPVTSQVLITLYANDAEELERFAMDLLDAAKAWSAES